MLRFQLFGIPFVVAPYFWVFSAILGSNIAQRSSNGMLLLAVWVACVFVSIVVHELGHAFAARRYGLRPAISLVAMGGLTSFVGGSLTRAQHIAVSLAGPAAGYVFYLVVRVFRGRIDTFGIGGFFDDGTTGGLAADFALKELLFINLWWTVYNLIPVLPLDGGQVLRDVLGPRFVVAARLIGAVCAVAAALYAVRIGQIYMALLFGFLAFANFRGDTRSPPGGVSRAQP